MQIGFSPNIVNVFSVRQQTALYHGMCSRCGVRCLMMKVLQFSWLPYRNRVKLCYLLQQKGRRLVDIHNYFLYCVSSAKWFSSLLFLSSFIYRIYCLFKFTCLIVNWILIWCSQFLNWFLVIALSASALGSIKTILVFKIGMIIVGFECSIFPVNCMVHYQKEDLRESWPWTSTLWIRVKMCIFHNIAHPPFLSLFSSFID